MGLTKKQSLEVLHKIWQRNPHCRPVTSEEEIDALAAAGMQFDPEPAEKTDGQRIMEQCISADGEWLQFSFDGGRLSADVMIDSSMSSEVVAKVVRDVLGRVFDAAIRDDRRGRGGAIDWDNERDRIISNICAGCTPIVGNSSSDFCEGYREAIQEAIEEVTDFFAAKSAEK